MKRSVVTKLMLVILIFVSVAWTSQLGYVVAEKNSKPFVYKTLIKKKKIVGDKCTIKVKQSYRYVQLKGTSAKIKNINKKLKKLAKEYMKDCGAFELAKEAADVNYGGDEYFEQGTQAVSYLSDKIISVHIKEVYYVGFGGHASETGVIYNLGTGKRIKKITSVSRIKKLSQVKVALIVKLEKKGMESYVETLLNKKSTDFDFYINKKGNITVCINDYDPLVEKLYLKGARWL